MLAISNKEKIMIRYIRHNNTWKRNIKQLLLMEKKVVWIKQIEKNPSKVPL